MNSLDWKFTWYTDWEEILNPEFMQQWQQWLDLAKLSHVFYHPLIAEAWINTYRPLRNLKPFFCKAESEGNLFFLPLILWTKNWKNGFQRVLEPIGATDFDYHDPIWAGGSDTSVFHSYWEVFITEIKRKFRFKADMISLPGMRFKGISGGWVEEDTICIYNDLTAYHSEELLLQSLNASLRGDIRRQIRRLEEQGVVTLHQYRSHSQPEIQPSFNRFLTTHSERWPHAYKAPGFHAELLKKALDSGVVSYSELRLNGTSISWHLGFLWHSHYYYYMPAIEPVYSKFSPGKIHLYYLLVECIQRGITVFDHLRGKEDYKGQWSENFAHIYCYKHYGTSIPSRLRNFIALKAKKFVLELPAVKPNHVLNSEHEIVTQTTQKNPFKVIRKLSWREIFSPEFQEKWLYFYTLNPENQVFFHPSLCRAWVETYDSLRNIKPLFYLITWDNKEVLIPLILWKRNWKHVGHKLIKPIGHGDFDYSDPLSNTLLSKDEWQKCWSAVINDIQAGQSYDCISIRNLHERSIGTEMNWVRNEVCPYIDIGNCKNLKSFISQLPAKRAKDLRRRSRRLNEAGKVQINNFTSAEQEEALSELEIMLQIHSEHWPNAYKAPGFHANLIKYGLEAGTVHFSTFSLDGKTISWRLGFILGKRYYSYMPAYIQEYADFSPGKLHLLECIGYAIEHGCTVFDMLRGNEEYKSEWATGSDSIGIFKIGKSSLPSKIKNTMIKK